MKKFVATALFALVCACAAQAAEPTIGQKFAAISDGHFHTADSQEARDATELLAAAAKKYRTTPDVVAGLVVIGYNESKKKHFAYSMYDVAEALPVLDPRDKSTEDRAKQLMVEYIVARAGGQNHSEAVAGVRKLTEATNP
ncbi:hypothetical protein [Paraburkholderia humisilvae]|uniref:Uncharacterized protein n=1 Tax=Paraburkholderia humisilvae TaxID=627669 RepID=A0A6J5EC46_9BURK|nr:hypothetical protein [Paraburkholderia humisilvae]CAB3764180.1 hypothetical protein LMG29542_04804 [Paraburkholderia humisilvae]